jgi:hypothetical protein
MQLWTQSLVLVEAKLFHFVQKPYTISITSNQDSNLLIIEKGIHQEVLTKGDIHSLACSPSVF